MFRGFVVFVLGLSWTAGAVILPEGTLLQSADGTLVRDDANDAWFFEFIDDVNEPATYVPAGTRLQILPSRTLAQMVADANDRLVPQYRVNAQVTEFRGHNFLLAFYFLPLSRFKDAAEPNAPVETPEATPARTEGGPAIPDEVLAMLQSRRQVRGPQRVQVEDQPDATTRALVGRVGLIELYEGRWQFVPDGFGWNVSPVRYELLPSSVLEQAQGPVLTALNPIRFNVSGIITTYHGVEYLILQRAVRVYNYGNFN